MFTKNKKAPKINRLILPTVKGITVTNNTLSWKAVERTTVQPSEDLPPLHLAGYNIYKFARGAFIPRHPINKKPVLETYYEDKKSSSQTCYAIRAVFISETSLVQSKKDPVLYEGPTSKIVCTP